MTPSIDRLNTLKKAAIVSLGYLFAFAGAILATYLWERKILGPQPQTSSGIHTFGEALLLIGVFCLLAIAPTGLAYYFIGTSSNRRQQNKNRRQN